MNKTLLKKITEHYHQSADFNGLPLREIKYDLKDLEELIQEELVTLNFGHRHPNSHMLALLPETKEEIIEKIDQIDDHTCAYPTIKHLKKFNYNNKYRNKPFSKLLYLGEPQLKPYYFEPNVLERYLNDPRYSVFNDVQGGCFSVKYEETPERDKVFLETFGYAYKIKFKQRSVIVFLRYLSDLNSGHQQYWHSKMISGNGYFCHPDYAKSTSGRWPEHISVFRAFLMEIKTINKMTLVIKGVNLFKDEFDVGDDEMRYFAFLLASSKKKYFEFAELLDKLMSDNLNKNFFEGDLSFVFEKDDPRVKEGVEVGSKKGTISLLDEWLDRVNFQNDDLKNNMISTFRKVRDLRSKPSHNILSDEWDENYFVKQRDLVIEAYQSIKTLRLIFANHPQARRVGVNQELYDGKIRTF